MGTFVTQTSDKKRAIALKWWRRGCFGLLGFENFYTLKIMRGIAHFAAGILAILVIISGIYGIFTAESFTDGILMFVICGLFWGVMALPNLIKLKLGKFRDSNGAQLIE